MRKLKLFLLVIVALYVVLLIPVPENNLNVSIPAAKPFEWKADGLWQKLERDYAAARAGDTMLIDSFIEKYFANETALCKAIGEAGADAADKRLDTILSVYFELAPLVAARPQYNQRLIEYYTLVREKIKQGSTGWDLGNEQSKNALYRLLYGMRIATEEVLLQSDSVDFAPVLQVQDEPSATPSANLFGIRVHSGDLLVSRGGAEVSALISRGNDYPGNFSHVALLYVEEKTNKPWLIEAHIEKGVAVSSAEQYTGDKKMRFMVLRPRMNLPQLKADPMLPHKAAGTMYEEALKKHIPYDFKMNFYDSTSMFCSEVGSFAYKRYGIDLWKFNSTISSGGVVKWLADFGVENFVTQMPSDLEYDPQLSVVAEWRDPATLQKDHIDNAVMDALYEQAEKGKQIGYSTWKLPLVRMIKFWSIIKNLLGGIGPIPEGMSSQRALKNLSFINIYQQVREKTVIGISRFINVRHYYPPYWEILAMAKKAAGERD